MCFFGMQVHRAQHCELGSAVGPTETDGDENATQLGAADTSQVGSYTFLGSCDSHMLLAYAFSPCVGTQ